MVNRGQGPGRPNRDRVLKMDDKKYAQFSVLTHSRFRHTFSTVDQADNHRQLPLLAFLAVVALY